MISKASVFLTLARSASLAACSKEWPLNSSVNEIMVDIKDLKSVRIILAWLQIRKLLILLIAGILPIAATDWYDDKGAKDV